MDHDHKTTRNDHKIRQKQNHENDHDITEDDHKIKNDHKLMVSINSQRMTRYHENQFEYYNIYDRKQIYR